VVFSTPITYEEWENRGGHQPWRMEPFELMQVVASNLVPENISPHYLEEAWEKSGNMATIRMALQLNCTAQMMIP